MAQAAKACERIKLRAEKGVSKARKISCHARLDEISIAKKACLTLETRLLLDTKLLEDVRSMSLLRGLLAGAGAWKLGGGIISTILIFLLLYWLLGFFMN